MRRMLLELISSKIYRELKYFDPTFKIQYVEEATHEEDDDEGFGGYEMMQLMLIKYAFSHLSSILFHFFFPLNRKFP